MKLVSTAEEGIVWALDDEDDIWIWEEGKISVEEIVRNEKVGYKLISGKLVQVDTGANGRLVGVNAGGSAFMRTGVTTKLPQGDGWKAFDGTKWSKLTMCYTTGDVWGTKTDGSLYFREGCSDDNIMGTGWKQVTGRTLVDIDCGFRGQLYYIGKTHAGVIRNIDEEHPYGDGGWLQHGAWSHALEVRGNSDGSAIYILASDFNVIVRKSINPQSWYGQQVEVIQANLAHIGVGTEQLWGTDKFHNIFKRIGVTTGAPVGFGWKQIDGKLG